MQSLQGEVKVVKSKSKSTTKRGRKAAAISKYSKTSGITKNTVAKVEKRGLG